MSQAYNASDIEVLSGLDPVRRRPGMYTDTSRPNHLAQEVIDNSVDEALAGHCRHIDVILCKDGSLQVEDDGRGMPVDQHPKEKLPGVELILTRLHAGGKFSNKNYRFSGGLHGVGVSVVNALSTHLEVWIRRDGQEYNMSFRDGRKQSDLEAVGKVGQRQYRHHDPFLAQRAILRHAEILRAAAASSAAGQSRALSRSQGEPAYQRPAARRRSGNTPEVWQIIWTRPWATPSACPRRPSRVALMAAARAREWALVWQPDGGGTPGESYVNLIPTPQGGTHVNGLRAGLTEALREFCEFRSLLPRGVRITPEDVWEPVSFVLSVKMEDPQFSGQTKERLSSRECAAFVSGVVKDSLALWLNQHPDAGERIAGLAIDRAQRRVKASRACSAQASRQRPGSARQAGGLHESGPGRTELFLVEGDSAGGSPNRRGIASRR